MIVAARVKLPDPHPRSLPTRRRGSNPGKQRHHETEGGRGGACLGHEFMQGSAGQPTLRQATIDGGKAECEGFGGPKSFYFGQ